MATRKIFHRRGYAALYASQLRELRGDRDQIRIMTILLVTSWVSILVIAFYRGLTHREPDLLSAISFFLAFPVISALVYFPIWTIYASGDPARAAPGIALYLLLFAPRPYDEGQGLGRKDLEHLKAMAQAEQSSAEWRGGLLTNLIVALVVAMVAGDIALQLPPASLRAAIGAISPLPLTGQGICLSLWDVSVNRVCSYCSIHTSLLAFQLLRTPKPSTAVRVRGSDRPT